MPADQTNRIAALARHFGLTQSAVTQWRSNGVPVRRMKAVRSFTGGEVTLEEMLPEPARTEGAPAVEVAEAVHVG